MDTDLVFDEMEVDGENVINIPPKTDKPASITSLMFIIKLLVSALARKTKVIKGLQSKLEQSGIVYHIHTPASKISDHPKSKPKVPLHTKLLQKEEDYKFWTGFPNKASFDKIFSIASNLVSTSSTSNGTSTKNPISSKSKKTSPSGRKSKISHKDQYLLTLMKCRLGLLHQDLASRFGITSGYVSVLFDKWIQSLAAIFMKTITIPSSEQTKITNPSRFQCFPTLKSIIDCFELFIETPKDLQLQKLTFSNYKHHNTLNFFLACAANSQITDVSKAYPGSISDKQLTLAHGFLDKHYPGDLIMADRGFNLHNECAEKKLLYAAPPGKRGISQFQSELVKDTARIARLRILVEQVIGRLRVFRLIKNEIPITLIPKIDYIVTVCAGICNLYDPIYES